MSSDVVQEKPIEFPETDENDERLASRILYWVEKAQRILDKLTIEMHSAVLSILVNLHQARVHQHQKAEQSRPRIQLPTQ